MSRWFRFYEDVMDDPKVQMLSDAHYRGWTTLLCIASKNNGHITAEENVLAFALRKPLGKVRELVQVCLSAGLIDPTEDGYTPHNWNGRQFKSDDSKERVKQFRKRSNGRDCNGDVTAAVTPPDTEQNRTESETDKRKAILGFVVGAGGRKEPMSDENKIALFQKWLATSIGRNGWQIVGTAADPAQPGYGDAVAFCRAHAKKNGKGWPHKWPAPQATNGSGSP